MSLYSNKRWKTGLKYPKNANNHKNIEFCEHCDVYYRLMIYSIFEYRKMSKNVKIFYIFSIC